MKGLEKAKSDGTVDWEVVPYLDLINSVPSLATSSSCYGRIVLMDIPTGLKKDSKFLAKWHRKISFEEFWDALKKANGKSIWFKMEPLIIHISAKDMEAVKKLLEVKNKAGIKRGGIFAISKDRFQIELEGTQRMEVPVKSENFVITEDYGRVLVKEANEKIDKNDKAWKRFEKEFRRVFDVIS